MSQIDTLKPDAIDADKLPAEVYAGGSPLTKIGARDIQPGDHCVIYSRGRYRGAIVAKVGPKRATVEYTTAGAKQTQHELGNSEPTRTRKAVPWADVWLCGSIETASVVVIEPGRSGRDKHEVVSVDDQAVLETWSEYARRKAAEERKERDAKQAEYQESLRAKGW